MRRGSLLRYRGSARAAAYCGGSVWPRIAGITAQQRGLVLRFHSDRRDKGFHAAARFTRTAARCRSRPSVLRSVFSSNSRGTTGSRASVMPNIAGRSVIR
ncbi:hypothetical protein CDC45_18530 (plasmid) [Ralstonia pseudosolanacearum]|uniref:Uncharacterized protein n=1 Tax=Ralstonia nicotianae (strain ATCC BAA-1114 / GMI1000) TaxID=267608 RepID=Q8XTC9_RALN1|nr:hypothetical protein CDC45_18530 [Ralstonia pseudosolanacearum]CAD17335.1 hypothetical protein RSp0184 [Ralstonia pseudosolanacearum GMI1000]